MIDRQAWTTNARLGDARQLTDWSVGAFQPQGIGPGLCNDNGINTPGNGIHPSPVAE